MADLEKILKDVIYAGIGAVSTVIDKGSEAAEALVARGRRTLDENRGVIDQLKEKAEEARRTLSGLDLRSLTEEEREDIRQQLNELDEEVRMAEEKAGEAPAEAAKEAEEAEEVEAPEADEPVFDVEPDAPEAGAGEPAAPEAEARGEAASEKAEAMQESARIAADAIGDALQKAGDVADEAVSATIRTLKQLAGELREALEKNFTEGAPGDKPDDSGKDEGNG